MRGERWGVSPSGILPELLVKQFWTTPWIAPAPFHGSLPESKFFFSSKTGGLPSPDALRGIFAVDDAAGFSPLSQHPALRVVLWQLRLAPQVPIAPGTEQQRE